MGLQINNNIAAFNSYRNLSVTQGNMEKSLEKLSSGFRINRAADDAAGLAISEGLRSQVGGLKVAVRNAQDGISVVQTAEGALTETHAILQRMRDLSVQGANDGGLNNDAKGTIQAELGQLKNELTRIADTTQFNGTKLLDSTYDGKFQVGANVGESINVKIGTSMSATGLAVDGVDVTSDGVGSDVTEDTASVIGTAGAFTVGSTNDLTASEGFDGLTGVISIGGQTLDLSSVKHKSGDDAAAKLANLQSAVDAKFGLADDGLTSAVTLGGTATGLTVTQTDAPVEASDILAVTQASGADGAITAIDEAIKTVSTERAALGALQNRFDHTIKNLNVAVENLSASESRIRDTDMALEMVNFTKSQILSQAGTAMLAQANQAPQGVLSLLR